ncbi:MAG: Omp28 family outer membrane lipoprotein [Clostridium sp.]|nr:Omp28 family outer membrane lipoprotein [Prevotella sp.]MCM1429272.1 Omp28 family outer membrane lipoprotein [Clostridium sp.]MCM1475695.1 Omp28 family outer membrane lipoprotein [Muribaculaceae bacterium]
MKTINILTGVALAVSALALTGCDDIAPNDRLIEQQRPKIARKVMIQEFSGIRCTNCPEGARTITSLQEQYPGSIVCVSLQPEGLNLTRPVRGSDFTIATKEARDYYDYYKVSGLPSAVIDGASPIELPVNWPEPIIKALEVESPVILSLKSSFDESSRQMTAEYDVTFNELYAQKASILVWISESKIIGPQIDGSKTIMDYEHNHVFRASANGMWGNELGTTFLPDDNKKGTVKFTIDKNWNADNCHVVAFVFDSSSKAVLQAEEIHLK